MRRRAQLLHLRPDLHVMDMRGSVDARLQELEHGNVDATLLALAGDMNCCMLGRQSNKLKHCHLKLADQMNMLLESGTMWCLGSCLRQMQRP